VSAPPEDLSPTCSAPPPPAAPTIVAPPAPPSAREASAAPCESRTRVIGGFLLLAAAVQLAAGPILRLSQWELSAERNPCVAEAAAWLDGRADLPIGPGDPIRARPQDTAYVGGRVYNVFPPLVTFLTLLLAPLHRLLLGRSDMWLQTPYVFLVFWSPVVAGYWVFRRECRSATWGALLAFAWIAGTAVLPCLESARTGRVWHVNHLLSQVGLLVMAADLLGSRRIWPAMIGLALAVWTRQLTILFALPVLWAAVRERRVRAWLVGMIAIVAPLLILNALRFGSPWESGYRFIYAGREDEWVAQRCLDVGLFSPRFAAENGWFMHLSPPALHLSHAGLRIEGDPRGTCIWLTSPLLLFVPICIHAWWRDAARRALMLGSFAVMTALLTYHNTGFDQRGCHRFALDFIPVWLAVIAPQVAAGRGRYWLIAAATFSTLYYTTLLG